MSAAPDLHHLRFYSIPDAAQILGLPRSTLYRMLREGAAPYVIVGGAKRMTLAHLEAVHQQLAGEPPRAVPQAARSAKPAAPQDVIIMPHRW